ncbi:MAG: hypothetical protein IJ567_07835 [Lachnospiraceae bacterium]|nr:hypothetical protein [Lachnospiraceae bacterium]
MGKPTIGAAVTPAIRKKDKTEIKELTVLKEGSRESIYHLIFSGADKGGM